GTGDGDELRSVLVLALRGDRARRGRSGSDVARHLGALLGGRRGVLLDRATGEEDVDGALGSRGARGDERSEPSTKSAALLTHACSRSLLAAWAGRPGRRSREPPRGRRGLPSSWGRTR